MIASSFETLVADAQVDRGFLGKGIQGNMTQDGKILYRLNLYGSIGTQGLGNHLPGRVNRTILSTGPTSPED